jgi:seryl-tRNA synthetase
MIDLSRLDDDSYYKLLKQSLEKRGNKTVDLDKVKNQFNEKKKLLAVVDEMRATRKRLTESFQKAPSKDLEKIKKEVVELKESLQKKEKELEIKDQELNDQLFYIPNILLEDVPFGKDDSENKEILRWGEVKESSFVLKSHDVIGEQLKIIDVARGVKISGSRFFVLRDEGAMLERALINFFLDEALANGFKEVFVPFIVKGSALFGTGQLPKFQEDLFKIEGEDSYLIPTAEVPITNLYSQEILKEDALPMYFVGFSSCFRKEAGSYGKDTKGIFRVHQFQKVELVKYILPSQGEQELESLVSHVRKVLEKLELPYRQVLLCSGDTGFSSCKTYDLEVYIPSEKRYREVSSCSYFGDFQSRRAGLKYKSYETEKNQFYHTINGSGIAIERIFVAILENFQTADGRVMIPRVLRTYMKNKESIDPK